MLATPLPSPGSTPVGPGGGYREKDEVGVGDLKEGSSSHSNSHSSRNVLKDEVGVGGSE